MKSRHWLSGLVSRVAPKQRQRVPLPRHDRAEVLEERVLLSIASTFNRGHLNLAAAGSENLTLSADAGSGNILLNGEPLRVRRQTVLASAVTRLTVSGGPGPNRMDASAVNQLTFTALATNRISLSGAGGADTIWGTEFNDKIDGGNGDDLLVGNGGHDLLQGRAGRDELRGLAGNDSLYGGNDNDRLDGGDDNDLELGENGDDQLEGGTGDDAIQGGNGNDFLSGGDGADKLKGDRGDDIILGGAGNDRAEGGADNDGLAGLGGNDTLLGDGGRDSLIGGEANDSLLGGKDPDLLLGGNGDDRLDGQTGRDTVAGGPGNDRIADSQKEINENVTFAADWLPVDGETVPPVLTAGLMNDTGRSSSDGITFNAAIQGTLTDASAIALFKAGFDSTPVANFVNVLPQRLSDGRFTLDAARMAAIAGGVLSDGLHTLHLVAEDEFQNRTTRDITFTLDTTLPTISRFDLSMTSDTGTLGDQTTTSARVALTGVVSGMALATGQLTTESQSVQIQIPALGLGTVANADGGFQFPDVMLNVGPNEFMVEAIDVAGNIASFARTITREAATASGDVVLTWNRAALEAIKLDASTPPVATRNLAIASLAMFDAINAIENLPAFVVAFDASPGTSAEAAVAAAAHRALSYAYPAQQAILDAKLLQSLSTIPDGAAETNGITLGRQIADAILTQREDDGYRDFVDHVPGSAPGQWQPTAPMFDVALLPQWADLRPFAMTSPDQFRPDGPPELTSIEYATAWDEVRRLGEGTGSERTADQTAIARFWADGPGTYTPPGHWNLIAADVAQQQGNSLAANARLFAQLNVALADAAIVAWDAKYEYEFWRPETAIRNADLDGNDATVADPAWVPFLITPPFPEYVSGHSTFSGAAAQVLTAAFGNNASFTSAATGFNVSGQPVQRTFDNAEGTFTSTFQEAAAEAGQSRIYGGIHFQFANQDGQAAGRALADHVLSRFTVTADTLAPTVTIISPDPDGVFANNFTLQAQALDNLSGVTTLIVGWDSIPTAPPVSLTPDSTGRFTYTTALPTNGTADGPHTLTFTARDAAGNQSTTNFTFTLDTRAPTITLDDPLEGDELSEGHTLTGLANGTGSAITELCYRFDTGINRPMIFDRTTGQFSEPLDLSRLTVGAHTLHIDARDAAGNLTTLTVNVTLPELIPFGIEEITPVDGADDVGTTFRPQVFFTRPVEPASLNANNFFATDTTRAKLQATIVPADDGSFAWLFFAHPLPGASTITLHLDGSTILAAADGVALDADADDLPGGLFESHFTTLSSAPSPGTSLAGIVADPGPDLKPGTIDDVQRGPDGLLMTPDDVYLLPIAHVKVFVLGFEDQAVFTDAQGRFTLDTIPAGHITVSVDGRTATNTPTGVFFPEMTMDLDIEPGRANTLMGTMGTRETREANLNQKEVYLPRLQQTILTGISSTQPTMVGVDGTSAPNLTPEQQSQLHLMVQPGSLIGPDGQPVENGQVGVSMVPPEFVRDMLPEELRAASHTMEITIQAPGTATFRTPIQITFPNTFGAAPGSKLTVLSFDHTTGLVVPDGTATVSADGLTATSDPDSGIQAPGWHFIDRVKDYLKRCIPKSLSETRILDFKAQAEAIAANALRSIGEVREYKGQLKSRKVLDEIALLLENASRNGGDLSDEVVCDSLRSSRPQLVDIATTLLSLFSRAESLISRALDGLARLSAAAERECQDIVQTHGCSTIFIDVVCFGLDQISRFYTILSAGYGASVPVLEDLEREAGVFYVDLLIDQFCNPSQSQPQSLSASAPVSDNSDHTMPTAGTLQLAQENSVGPALFDSLTETPSETFLTELARIEEAFQNGLSQAAQVVADAAFVEATHLVPLRSYFVLHFGNQAFRGQLSSANTTIPILVLSGAQYSLSVFDPESGRIAHASGQTERYCRKLWMAVS